MSNEVIITGKDSVKLNLLNEALNGSAEIKLTLNGSTSDFARDIHRQNGQVHIFGNFTISEEAPTNSVKIRPTSPAAPLKAEIRLKTGMNGKTAGIFRSASKSIEQEFPIKDSSAVLTFEPSGSGFTVKLVNESDAAAEELRETQTKISAVEQKRTELDRQKETASAKLQRIEEEYRKDQNALQSELNDLKARMQSDETVLQFYKDKDVKPTEELLAEAAAKLSEAEAQIRLFIEAKQRKSMEIENEVKS